MRSLFRIDRSAVQSSTGAYVRLPNLEDLLQPGEPEKEETHALPDEEEAPEDAELREKRKEIEQLQQEMEQIREEAQQLLAETEEQCKNIQEQARQEGFRSAAEQAEHERAAEREEFQKLCNTVQAAALEHQRKVEEGIFQVAIAAAEKIVAVELDRSDEAFLQIVRQTAALLQQDTEKAIRVSREDYRRFFAGQEDVMEASGIRIEEDASLKRGDCIMLSEFGTVNTSAGSQLERMKRAAGETGHERA